MALSSKSTTLTAGNGVISTTIVNPGNTTTPPANPVPQVSDQRRRHKRDIQSDLGAGRDV